MGDQGDLLGRSRIGIIGVTILVGFYFRILCFFSSSIFQEAHRECVRKVYRSIPESVVRALGKCKQVASMSKHVLITTIIL